MNERRRRLVALALVAASLLFVVYRGSATMNDRLRYRSDAEHLKMAWNLAAFGVLSTHDRHGGALRPNWRREPLYPALLAGVLALQKEPLPEHFDCLLVAEPPCRPLIRAMKWLNVALLVALMAASAWAARVVLGPGPLAWLAYGLVYTNGVFWSLLQDLRTETAAALALLVASTCLFRIACGSRRARDVAGAGLAFGALMLLKAMFMYVGMALVPLVLWIGARPQGRAAALRLGAALLVAYAVGGAWMARNAAHGGPFRVSEDRAVLAIRAEYDTMRWREWRAAWLYYARSARLPRWALARWFDPADSARLRRENPEGFYRKAKADVGAAAALTGERKPKSAVLEAAARRVILQHLPMHVALVGPLSVQGFFVHEQYFSLWPVRVLQEWTASWMVPGLLVGAAVLLVRRRPEPLAFFAPALVCFALHVAATHNISRYSWPLLPTATIASLALPALVRARFPAPAPERTA